MANTYRLKVDLKLNKTGIVPTFVQYDDARLEFEIFDNGKPFDFTGFTIAEFAHKKPDGTSVIADGVIETDLKGKRIVAYDYQGSEMSKAGFVETSFSIFNDANEKVSILPFKVKMVADLRDEAFNPASPEFGKLQQYAAELQALKAEMQTTIDESVAATTEINEVIVTGNQLNTDLSSLKTATETVRSETAIVKTDTLAVKNATQIVQDETVAVKNATQSVQEATELVRANTEAVRLETVTAKDETIAATGEVTAAVDNANAIANSWTYVGEFNLNTAYKKHNVVTFNGEGYIAIKDVTGIAPTGQASDTNWKLFARKGQDGTGTTVVYVDKFTATANQTLFNLTHSYDQLQNRLSVYVGGIKQHSPENFMETSSKSFTLADPVSVGTEVIAEYFSEAPVMAADIQEQIDQLNDIVQYNDVAVVQQMVEDIGHMGTYSPTTAYTENNVVDYNGSSYMALKNTTGNVPTNLAGDLNWKLVARKGADGTGTVVRHRQEFTSTANQTVFNLANKYDQNQNRLDVTIGNVPQYSPSNFTETSNTSFTLTEPIPAGLKVIATYFSEAVPLATDLETEVNSHTTELVSVNNTLSTHTTQLAETATKQELAAVASGAPKGTYATLADLQTAFPTGNANIYLVTADGKWYYWNGSAWTAGGVYQSSGIADGTVTIAKTGFFSASRRNLYNPAAAVSGLIDNANGNVLANTSYKTSDYMPVSANNQYFMSLNYNLAFYDVNKVFISGTGGGWGTSLPVAERYVLTVPNNANIKYVRVTANSNDSSFMFVEGAAKPAAYIPFGVYTVSVSDPSLAEGIKKLAKEVVDTTDITFEKQSIDVEAVESFDIQKINLANPAEFAATNTFVNSTNGSVTTLSGYVASGFIEVTPSSNYRISHTNDYAWYDANKAFISGRSGGWAQAPVTSPANAKYVRASFTSAYTSKMVVKGDVLPASFIPYDSAENIVFSFATEDWKSKFIKALGVKSNRLSTLKWNVLGDSLTDTATTASEGYPYHKWISERTGITVNNYGISMSTVSDMVGNPQGYDPASYNPMVTRYQNMTNDADVITIMAGINDVLHGAPLGVLGDTGTNTFYGALDTLIVGLINKYPTKSIGYILPPFAIPELDTTKKRETFTKAIKEVCKKYTIPVLDLYTNNQLGGAVPARANLLVPDGVHPTKLGHQKLSYSIEQFLLSI